MLPSSTFALLHFSVRLAQALGRLIRAPAPDPEPYKEVKVRSA